MVSIPMKSSKPALAALAVLFLAFLMPLYAEASTFGSGNGFRYVIEDGSATIREYYRPTGTEIEVPSMILTETDSVPVNTIASGAFSLTKTPELTKVLVPSSVVKIEDNAIPEGITVVRNYKTDEAYSYVQGRTTVGKSADGFLYKNDAGQLTITGYEGSEKEITIPKTIANCRVTHIEAGAFQEKPLRRISVPKGITFGENALLGQYQVILDCDTENPVIVGSVPSETEAPTRPGGNEVQPTKPDESYPPTGEEVDFTFPEEESSTEEPMSDEQPSIDPETEESSSEAVPSEPAGPTPGAPGNNSDKGLRPIDWILIALAGAVFIGAVISAVLILKKRNRTR